jgi:hypothetical protein
MIMNTFLYDFKNNQTVNPFEGVTHFYVCPYEMSIWRTLFLANKIQEQELQMELVIQESTGLPLIIVPIEALGLGKCMIKMNDDFSGKIISGKRTIYFRPTEQDHVIRITTVLN